MYGMKPVKIFGMEVWIPYPSPAYNDVTEAIKQGNAWGEAQLAKAKQEASGG